jgi:hypothetical protein
LTTLAAWHLIESHLTCRLNAASINIHIKLQASTH